MEGNNNIASKAENIQMLTFLIKVNVVYYRYI